MLPTFDIDKRLRKRIFSLLVVQSTPAFIRYTQQVNYGAAPELVPPDPYDVDISVRRWKWLLSQYDKGIERIAFESHAC